PAGAARAGAAPGPEAAGRVTSPETYRLVKEDAPSPSGPGGGDRRGGRGVAAAPGVVSPEAPVRSRPATCSKGRAGVAELADAPASEAGGRSPWGFDSLRPHHRLTRLRSSGGRALGFEPG